MVCNDNMTAKLQIKYQIARVMRIKNSFYQEKGDKSRILMQYVSKVKSHRLKVLK
jgi:hypothetical protein